MSEVKFLGQKGGERCQGVKIFWNIMGHVIFTLKKKLIKYIIHLYAIFKKYCHCQLSCVLKFV